MFVYMRQSWLNVVWLALPWQPRGIFLAFEWYVQLSYVSVWKEKHCLELSQWAPRWNPLSSKMLAHFGA